MQTTGDRPEPRGSIVPPGEGRAFGYGPSRLNVKIGPEAGGAFGVVESVLPPGGGPSPHRHRRFDEAFYVLEGEIEYRVGPRRVLASVGACVFAPAGVTHSFRNVSTREARHLVIAAPPEALEMIEAAGQATGTSSPASSPGLTPSSSSELRVGTRGSPSRLGARATSVQPPRPPVAGGRARPPQPSVNA